MVTNHHQLVCIPAPCCSSPNLEWSPASWVGAMELLSSIILHQSVLFPCVDDMYVDPAFATCEYHQACRNPFLGLWHSPFLPDTSQLFLLKQEHSRDIHWVLVIFTSMFVISKPTAGTDDMHAAFEDHSQTPALSFHQNGSGRHACL